MSDSHRGLAVLAFLLLTGCGASSGSSAPAQQYSIELQANSQPVSGSPLLLFTSQFLEPGSNYTLLTLTVTPPASPTVVWSSSGAAVALSPTQPNCTGCPSPPPGSIYAAMAQAGSGTVTATIGPPVNATISEQVFSYLSLAVGCQFRYSAAYDFDPGNTVQDLTSDLYATESTSHGGTFDPCTGTAFATGTDAIHFPYGGFALSAGLSSFPTIAASQWQNAGSSVPAAYTGAVLFKTRAGAIVKAWLPLGPYEVTDVTGKFPY
ncbi:MAG: hypothetical protein JOZ38_12455 [Candidatus Eremiobacteraeota bacterium]|nr:hypothetical protein [Candidatus Eremiobacteraeota bacterium]